MEPVVLSSLTETKNFALSISRILRGGDLLGLSGELGAGKTELTRALLYSLGYRGVVSSPSYVLEQIYSLPGDSLSDDFDCSINEVLHYDFYRLSGSLDELGVGEILPSSNQIAIIEWPEKVLGLEDLLSKHIKLEFFVENEKGLERGSKESDSRRALLLKGFCCLKEET